MRGALFELDATPFRIGNLNAVFKEKWEDTHINAGREQAYGEDQRHPGFKREKK